MPTRNLPPQTGAGSPRAIYGEFGVDGGFSDVGATTIVNPRPKGVWEHLDLMWTGLVGKRSTGRGIEPDEMLLVGSRTVTTAGAIDATDERRQVVFNSGTPITVTLPALATAGDGFEFYVLNRGAGTVTLDPDSTEQIEGLSTVDLPTGMAWIVKACGSTHGWRVLGRDAIARIPGAGSVAGGVVTTDAAGRITGIAASTAALPRGYIDGLTLANNATDLTNDIDIAAGVCRNAANTLDVSLAATLVKQLDVAWAAGTNAGGRDTGSIADGTWHVWLIRNTTTAVVDALLSLSATAPTVPSGWATVRRLGAVLRESSALVRFTQTGDEFRRAGFVNGINTTNAGTSQVSDTIAGLPAGIKVRAALSVILSNTTTNAYAIFGDPDGPSLPTPSATVFHHAAVGGGGAEFPAVLTVPTNTSRQIARLFSGTGVSNKYVVTALGWTDLRGKDA
jgi:hypothetical protein